MVRALLVSLTLWAVSAMSYAEEPASFISIELESEQVYLTDTVMLHVVSTGLREELSFEALDALPFERRETVGSFLRIYEGKLTEFATRRIELIPQQTGRFTIGPITAGAIRSESLSLEVLEGTPQAWNLPPDAVQLETRLTTTTPYAQQMLVYEATLRHHYPLQVSDFVMPQFSGFRVIADKVEKRIWHDDGWRSIEWRYLLFPEQTGDVSIAPMQATGTVARSRWETARFDRTGAGFELEVQAPPAGDWWLPASTLTLTDHWSRPINALQVGQAVTRSLTVLAEGVSASQLPHITMPAMEGARIKLINTDRGEQFDDERLSARLKLEFEVVPQVTGALATAPITLSWWNTSRDQAETAEVPARRLLASLPDRADLADAYRSGAANPTAFLQRVNHVPGIYAALAILVSLIYLLIRLGHAAPIKRLLHPKGEIRGLHSALKAQDRNKAWQLLTAAKQTGLLSPAGDILREELADMGPKDSPLPAATWAKWRDYARHQTLLTVTTDRRDALPPL